MNFRRYETADLAAMFALDEACFEARFRFSFPVMRRFAETKKARIVIAEEDGLAGFCLVHVERVDGECVGYVVTLDVAEKWRRKGLAGELMRRLEVEVREAGCGAMVLHVFVGNEGAIRFYERNGYERGKRAAGFYGAGGVAWVYRKVLGAEPVSGGEWESFPR